MKKDDNLLQLAEKIDADIEKAWALCCDAPRYKNFIREYFKPNYNEENEYKMGGMFWLSSLWQSRVEDNEFRIMVLLFAQHIWNDLTEEERVRISSSF
jgi:hypothetical protein